MIHKEDGAKKRKVDIVEATPSVAKKATKDSQKKSSSKGIAQKEKTPTPSVIEKRIGTRSSARSSTNEVKGKNASTQKSDRERKPNRDLLRNPSPVLPEKRIRKKRTFD